MNWKPSYFILLASLALLTACTQEPKTLAEKVAAADKVVFQGIDLDQKGDWVEITDTAVLNKIKRIPQGDVAPAMKCAASGSLIVITAGDTAAQFDITLETGCNTVSFMEAGKVKSLWLDNLLARDLEATFNKSLKRGPLHELTWIIGEWKLTEQDGSQSTETWRKISDEKLQGFAFTMMGKDTVFQERIEIVAEGTDAYYVVKVQENDAPVRFKRVESSKTRTVFENKEHDFPQVITYEKAGDNGMLAAISGEKNGQFGKKEFPFVRAQ